MTKTKREVDFWKSKSLLKLSRVSNKADEKGYDTALNGGIMAILFPVNEKKEADHSKKQLFFLSCVELARLGDFISSGTIPSELVFDHKVEGKYMKKMTFSYASSGGKTYFNVGLSTLNEGETKGTTVKTYLDPGEVSLLRMLINSTVTYLWSS